MVCPLELAAYIESVFEKRNIPVEVGFRTWEDKDGVPDDFHVWAVDLADLYLFSAIYNNDERLFPAQRGLFTLHRRKDDSFSHYRRRCNVNSLKRGVRRVSAEQQPVWAAYASEVREEGFDLP